MPKQIQKTTRKLNQDLHDQKKTQDSKKKKTLPGKLQDQKKQQDRKTKLQRDLQNRNQE